MPAKKIVYPLFEEPHQPIIVAKIIKGRGDFRYSISLNALIKGESTEIVRIDNYHGKHHIHEL